MTCCGSSKVINDGTSIVVMMRIVGVDQALITQGSVTAIQRKLVNVADSTSVPIEPFTDIPVNGSVFDTPQFDYGWPDTENGYNFRDIFTAVAGEMVAVYEITDIESRPIIATVSIPVAEVP